jgi:hypothetical protein
VKSMGACDDALAKKIGRAIVCECKISACGCCSSVSAKYSSVSDVFASVSDVFASVSDVFASVSARQNVHLHEAELFFTRAPSLAPPTYRRCVVVNLVPIPIAH